IVFQVFFVVFFVIGYQVVQSKAIMCGDKVDACGRPSVVVPVQVAASCESFSKLRQHTVSAPPIIAHAVAILAIPLDPSRREISNLVATFSEIPGFGDQLDLRDDRVLVYNVEEPAQPVYFMQFPCKGGSQVEAETVDMHFDNPVAQTIHNDPENIG